MQVGNSVCVLVYASEFSLMEMYLLPIFLQVFAKLLQSCPTLCDPMDCSPPGSSAHGVIQARILKWVAMPSSRGSSWPRDQTRVSYGLPALAGGFFTTSATWEAKEHLGSLGTPRNISKRGEEVLVCQLHSWGPQHYLKRITFVIQNKKLSITRPPHGKGFRKR